MQSYSPDGYPKSSCYNYFLHVQEDGVCECTHMQTWVFAWQEQLLPRWSVLLHSAVTKCSWHCACKKLLWYLSWGTYTLWGWVKATLEIKFRRVLVNFHYSLFTNLGMHNPLTGENGTSFSAAVTLMLSSMSLFHCWMGRIKAFSARQPLLDSCK